MLRGDLGEDTLGEELNGELERHYVDDGVRVITVELKELRSITLEGVGVLLQLWRESRHRGKRFVVQNAQGQVRAKLQVTGLLEPFSKDRT